MVTRITACQVRKSFGTSATMAGHFLPIRIRRPMHANCSAAGLRTWRSIARSP